MFFFLVLCLDLIVKNLIGNKKFIDGLPSLFAHKVKDDLIDTNTGLTDYENLTYGDLFSTIKKLGIKMCIDQKMIRQQLKNAKKAKYEMGNFCEQFRFPPIAPSRKNRKKSDKVFRKKPTPYYNSYKKRKFNKTSKNFSKKHKTKDSKFEKYFSKGKCFNCGESWHFSNKCPKPPKKIKQEINALNIEESEKENIFRILQNNDFFDFSSEEDFLTSDDFDYHSASEFSEDVKIGCFDSCCNKTKTCSVLTKAKEQEDLLITLISKTENPELKKEYLKKTQENND
jgi:hypothetical protein